jgi:predicted nucleic acid-binding protein
LILVDTSVWIDYFNGADNEYTAALDSALDAGTVAIGDLIFLEILQGFRNDREFKRARTLLEMLDQYEMFGHEMALKCAENYRDLTKKGITILTTTDVIIATFCIENQLPLLFSDRDFLPFVEKMGLRSVVEET